MAAAKKSAKKATKKAAKKTAKKATAKKATATKTAKKATAKKTAKKATAAAASPVVVTSKVRERLRQQDARMASDFVDALNAEVDVLVERAIQRAKDNGRSTVRPQDL